MTRIQKFELGIERLCRVPGFAPTGERIGLLAHPASVSSKGAHATVMLRRRFGVQLVSLFGPEHGFYGSGGAGDLISDSRHPGLDIPIYSLYGAQRSPTDEMLQGVDTIVFDLQDIAVRCYTFVSTLRYLMEACAYHQKRMIVCDRPVPLPSAVDGPMLDPAFESFVACVPMPLVYGMTPAESARFLHQRYAPALDLKIVPMRGYHRDEVRDPAWGPWISPSPGIRTWETVWTYPTTVTGEALPSLWYGRAGLTPFQVLTAPWINAENFARKMNESKLPGVVFHPCWMPSPGVRIQVTNPSRYRPVTSCVALLATLQKMYGREKLWGHPDTRPDFFDKLMGTDRIRNQLLAGRPWQEIVMDQSAERRQFMRERRAALLYS